MYGGAAMNPSGGLSTSVCTYSRKGLTWLHCLSAQDVIFSKGILFVVGLWYQYLRWTDGGKYRHATFVGLGQWDALPWIAGEVEWIGKCW